MATCEEATQIVKNRRKETECWRLRHALTHALSKQV